MIHAIVMSLPLSVASPSPEDFCLPPVPQPPPLIGMQQPGLLLLSDTGREPFLHVRGVSRAWTASIVIREPSC